MFGGRVHVNHGTAPLACPTGAGDRITTIPDRSRRFEMKAYIDHLTQAQYRLTATANQRQGNVLEQRIQKGPTKGAAKSFKFGDWVVIPWDGTDPHPGKNKPHKLARTWQGPYKVTGPGGSDSLIVVIDPADLKPYEFPIARCRL